MRIQESLKRYSVRLLFARFLFLLIASFQFETSYADFTGVRLGASYPTPLGTSFETLDHTVGANAGAWYSPTWLDPSLQFRLTGAYEPFYLRNLTSITVSTVSLLGGIQIQTGAQGTGFMGYFGLDIGPVYNWMTIAGVTTAVVQNSSVNFAMQAVPGFDYSITENFGVVLEMPIKLVFMRSPLTLFSSSLSLRLKL